MDIRMVPITTILRETTGSADLGDIDDFDTIADFWLNIINRKAADTGFGHLVDSILTNGWDANSSIGWDNGIISEGHHRLVAAILLCEDEIAVSYCGSSGEHHVDAHDDDLDPNPIVLVEGIQDAYTYIINGSWDEDDDDDDDWLQDYLF